MNNSRFFRANGTAYGNWGIGEYSTTVSRRALCCLDAGRRAIQRRLQGFRLGRRYHLIALDTIDRIQDRVLFASGKNLRSGPVDACRCTSPELFLRQDGRRELQSSVGPAVPQGSEEVPIAASCQAFVSVVNCIVPTPREELVARPPEG